MFSLRGTCQYDLLLRDFGWSITSDTYFYSMINKTYIDKLAYIFIKDRKVMLTQEKGNKVWIIPRGKRENGETDIETLTRELKEELSVNLVQNSAKLFKVYEGQAHGHQKGTIVRIACYLCDYIGDITLNSPIDKTGWIDSKENNVSTIGKILLEDLKNKNVID